MRRAVVIERRIIRWAAVIAACFAWPASLEAAPEWHWRPVLSVPRIGGRLRTITVDPKDPLRLYVGTEEGTLLRSQDGGITWRELDIGPFVVVDRSVGLQVPGLPELGEETPNNFSVFVDPPDLQLADRVPIPSVADPFPVRPDFFFAGFLATSDAADVSLLYDVTRSRTDETIPVRRVILCPGAPYPLMVATWSDLYGSTDDGLTWVRLFANPGEVSIESVACDPDSPKHIAVATGVGLFTSWDGGFSFDQDLSAWPGQEATAVAFAKTKNGTTLFSASDSELYAGDPRDKQGMQYVYPGADSSTAPWLTIRAIASPAVGELWLATDDGARMSLDGGETWETVARTLFDRQTIRQVVVGRNERGQKRVALMINQTGSEGGGLQDSIIYSSDDGGKSWEPFFHGLSRRTFRQMAAVGPTANHPGGWWVVTSGELWTTAPIMKPKRPVDRAAIQWAEARLAATPPLSAVLNGVLDHTRLSSDALFEMAERHRSLNWVPRLDVRLTVDDRRFGAYEGQLFGEPVPGRNTLTHQTDALSDKANVELFVQALWEVYDVIGLAEQNSPVHNALHELRRRVSFDTEDAWTERVDLLRTLAVGLDDVVQVESVKVRIESLEAMIELWLGGPLASADAVASPR